MKKVLFVIVVIAVVVGGYVATGAAGVGNAAQSAQASPSLPPVKAGNKVVAKAKVVPARHAALSLPASGLVAEVLVAEGDRVEAGQPLVRLAAGGQSAAVAQGEATLRRSQARLDELKAGPRPQEIASAEASLAAAQAALQRLLEGADENQLIAARAELANAEAALQLAQAEYDRAGGPLSLGIGASPVSLKLQQATNNYNAAKARLAALEKGPSAADIAAAQAEIRRAQAQLDLVKAGPRPEAIAAAEADVASAQAALKQSRAALADTELRAPFAGFVASLDAKVGEEVTGGFVPVRLADISSWQVETTDLTELQVTRIQVGDQVTVTFDAITGLEVPATVSRIGSVGQNKQGDIVYTVVVKPQGWDERLRWNMSALVSIQPK